VYIPGPHYIQSSQSITPLKQMQVKEKKALGIKKNNIFSNTLTINVPLFKKLRDIIFFWWKNHFMSHFEGHFEGAKTFLTP
jgi:hypothetical protein